MAAMFQNRSLNPRPESENLWSLISPQEALEQSPPFAAAFFNEVKAVFPAFFASLRFMTWPGLSDLYAFHDTLDSPVGIQIDCDLEYIIIWSVSSHAGEYGDWGDGIEAQVSSAMEALRSLLHTT